MNFHGWTWDLLGWVALPVVAVLLGVFLVRRWVSEYPFFFSYLIATEVVGIVRLAWFAAPIHTYYYVYWISDIIYTCFSLVATYELFVKRLFPGFYKVRLYRYIFLLAALLTTLSATALALISGHLKVLQATIYVYSFVRALILVFFIALMLIMGRQWTRQEFGIAFGFGLDVSTALLLLGTWTHNISGRSGAIAISSVIAYDLACLIWIYCFWNAPKSEPAVPTAPLSPAALDQAKKWEESLKDYMSSGKR